MAVNFATSVLIHLGFNAIDRVIGIIFRGLGYVFVSTAFEDLVQRKYYPEAILARMVKETPYSELASEEKIRQELKEVVGFINFLKDFNVDLTKWALVWGIASPEIGFTAGQLANALQWSYGLGWLSWIGTGEVLSRLVQKPIKQKLNYLLRDADIPRDVLEKMYAYNQINLREFKERMANEGWKDEDIEKYKLLLWSELRSEALEELVRLGVIDVETYKQKLREIGFSGTAADIVVKKLFKLPSLGEIRRALKNGLIRYEQARELLILQGYLPEHADLLLSDIRAEKIEESRDLTKSDILRAFELGVINEQSAREFLKVLGYDNDEINILIELTKKRIALKNLDKGRDLAKSDIINAYIKDVIDATEAKDLLRKIGYDENEINILIQLADAKRKVVPKEKKREIARSDIVKAYKLGEISKEEAINMLKQLGFSEQDAELILKIGSYEKPKERRLTLSELRRLYNEGLLTLNEYREALIALGYNPEDVDLLIIREKPRLTASMLLDAFRAGVIDMNFIFNYAQREGMTWQEIVFLHRNGALTDEQARELLRKFGFDDKEIEILLRFAR